jgi:hypothetical protein
MEQSMESVADDPVLCLSIRQLINKFKDVSRRMPDPERFQLAMLEHLLVKLIAAKSRVIPHSISERFELEDGMNVLEFAKTIERNFQNLPIAKRPLALLLFTLNISSHVFQTEIDACEASLPAVF